MRAYRKQAGRSAYWRGSRAGLTPQERSKLQRWSAPGKARVVHPERGTVIVPCSSPLAAIMNAADVWGCSWTELDGARVWAAEPGDTAEKYPYII